MTDIKRGDIWLVNLDPTVGHEIKKTRPAVIIQNDIGNKFSSVTIIAPVTSQHLEKIYPVEVKIEAKKTGIDTDSKVLLSHIRSVDKLRLLKKIGKVDELTMGEIDDALLISLGLRRIE